MISAQTLRVCREGKPVPTLGSSPRACFSGSCSNLRNDVRRDLVFDEGDAVAQLQLALLQPLQPQQIRRGRLMAAANPARAIDAAHRSPRRDRGVPAAAVRARIRVRAHLRWSWCTSVEKRDEVAKRCGSLWKEYRPCQPGLQASVVVTQKFSLFRRPVHHVKFEPKAHWNHEFPARPQIRTSPGRCSRGGGLRIRTMRVPWSRFVTYDTQYDTAIFDTHRQIRRLVYSRPSASNLNPTEEVSYGNSGSSR